MMILLGLVISCFSLLVGERGVCTILQEKFDNLQVSVFSGKHQWGYSRAIRFVNLCAMFKQEPGKFHFAKHAADSQQGPEVKHFVGIGTGFKQLFPEPPGMAELRAELEAMDQDSDRAARRQIEFQRQ